MEDINQAKLFYLKIRKVWNPIIKEYISFNRIGFRHLLSKGGKRRTKKDQRRRLGLLIHAADIIASPKSKMESEKRETTRIIHQHGKKAEIITEATFWAFTEKRGEKEITVVVRQVKNSKKHFFSIYDN